MRINRHDTNGTKPLLGKGELGYDDYTAGGDAGRVYVGTGTENIALAEKLEANIMTKAQFNALAEERKANRAGSGFDEWGKHWNSATLISINEGMISSNTAPSANRLIIGANAVFGGLSGVSKTNYPLALVNGVSHKINHVGQDLYSGTNYIQLPTVPTIYPSTVTLTAEQIASGVIKHADASNSGLIVNGKFDTDTSGWTHVYDASDFNRDVIIQPAVKINNIYGNTVQTGIKQSSPNIVIGRTYTIEFDVLSVDSGTTIYINGTSIGSINSAGRITSSWVATNNEVKISITKVGYATSMVIDNIAVYPADAISRSDLVFLESWHEDISEKNFVYPLGNVQYLGADTDGLTGIANGAFTGFETYSLFGNWQASSALIGKGYVWSTLTEVQKKAFVSNPENNCYLDGDKVIQVRYRVRVVQGVSDSINSFSKSNSSSYLALNESGVGSSFLINAKGKQTSIAETKDYASRVTTGTYGYQGSNTTLGVDTVSGDLVSVTTFGTPTNVAYEGKCFALPIALVHRRNQGAYHPVYNPNGTGSFWATSNTGVVDKWYNSNTISSGLVNSISSCFTWNTWTTPTTIGTAVIYGITSQYSGSISVGFNGRPDNLAYDQIHEGDILDLRNSSKKVEDYNRLISREFNKLVAGTYRGKEGEWQLVPTTIESNISYPVAATYFDIKLDLSSIQDEIGNTNTYKTVGYVVGNNGTIYNIEFQRVVNSTRTIASLNASYGDVRSNLTVGNAVYVCRKSTRTKSNTLLHCDIIGNPTNYPTYWKQSGVFGTPLLVAEDGTSLLPDGVKDTFKLSRKANATPLLCLRSTDSGVTWTSFTPTFNGTTNEITLTNEPDANLVMIYYQTHTSMAVPVVNSEVLEIGKVLGTNGVANAFLVSSLINKVSTSSTAPYLQDGYSISAYRIDTSTIRFSPTSTEIPIHSSLALAGGASGVSTIKVLPYLTRTNGKAYLNLVFKEMKHNGTSWGDDSKFNIANNTFTTTDNNAQTVLIGQKTVELPYFIAGDE